MFKYSRYVSVMILGKGWQKCNQNNGQKVEKRNAIGVENRKAVMYS